MADPRVLLATSLNFLIPLAIGGLLARLLPAARTQGTAVGASVGGVIVNTVEHAVDPSLRSIVLAEFASICNQLSTTNNAQTVLQTSTTLLAKVLPEVPTATVQQIAQIISEFVLTFEAGLTSEFTSVAQSLSDAEIKSKAEAAASVATAAAAVRDTPVIPDVRAAVQPSPSVTVVPDITAPPPKQ